MKQLRIFTGSFGSHSVRRPDLLALNAAISSRIFGRAQLWPTDAHHVRRPGWTELFYDLVFAAAISQLSTPLEHHFSIAGAAQYAFLLGLVFLAWLGYVKFSTLFAVDDLFQRALIIGQVFLVAVMAANATGPLNGTDAAGFGAAYGGVRAILAFQYFCVIRLPGTRAIALRRMVGLVVAAIIWITSAVLPPPYRYVSWAVAFLIELGNTWLPVRSTRQLPPGATHFPERFGLLTIILLGEFVASVMRGIESQAGWSVLAAAAAVISLALAFSIWSSYSDGAAGWEVRHVRSNKDVVRLRIWIGLHFLLFLGIGILGVGARRGIALPPGGHFDAGEQWLICFAASMIVVVITGIASTHLQRAIMQPISVWVMQFAIAAFLLFPGFIPGVRAAVLLFILFVAFVGQTMLLVLVQNAEHPAEELY